MKRAKLPDGKHLDFPDDADDECMDRTVKAYLGAAEKQGPDEVLSEVKELRAAVKALAESHKLVARAIVGSGEETIAATKAVAKAVKELKAPEFDVAPIGEAIAEAVDAAVKGAAGEGAFEGGVGIVHDQAEGGGGPAECPPAPCRRGQ